MKQRRTAGIVWRVLLLKAKRSHQISFEHCKGIDPENLTLATAQKIFGNNRRQCYSNEVTKRNQNL